MRRLPRILRLPVLLILLGLAGFAIYVRALPQVAALWHAPSYPSGVGHIEEASGHIWRGPQTGDGVAEMRALDEIITATARTDAIAGTVGEGMITYVTYSRWWRFPDFTTLERNVALIEGGPRVISLYNRARYGASDFGVNEGRIRDWLRQLQAGG